MSMSQAGSPDLWRRRDELVRRAAATTGAAEVFSGASRRLRRIVPHDASVWLMTDPGTGLPTSPTMVDGFDAGAGLCSAHWQHEFLVEDVNLFRDLARARVPASALRAAAGDPQRSPRYRRFLRPHGFADELRAVLRVGGAPWAAVTLWRRAELGPFSSSEVDLVASLSAPLGDALRLSLRPGTGGPVPQGTPGLLSFSRDGDLRAANDAARAWLAEIPSEEKVPTDLGVDLPAWMVVTAVRAGASLERGGDGTTRVRVRSRTGRWLVCHASGMRDPGGSVAEIAMVIDAASATQVASIVVVAYDLSEREQQITRLIARGVDTNQIAAQLHLSAHTVRDHIKAIFAKVGVSRRGELVAKLYADFYEPAHMGTRS
jgi:DNA-binding CsgD family transcriptional regulator